MKAKAIFALVIGMSALALIIAARYTRSPSAGPESQPPETDLSSNAPQQAPHPASLLTHHASRITRPSTPPPQTSQGAVGPVPTEELGAPTNKLQRLTRAREAFRVLAAGDPATALRAAKQIADETERETALLTLVTEWSQGNLSSPRQRAEAIATYGLEAGLGLELAKSPDLAVLWANELTDGPGRTALLQQTAIGLTRSDPAAAFALSDQLPVSDRRGFFDAVFAGWADNDTAAALQWADQLSDPAERDAAIQAIRSVAPVGIGAALGMRDGYPVINQVLSGTPAELSGQLHPGDRILALAQGDSSFVDAHGLSLPDIVQMIRGAPGTVLQLQILPADAPPNSPPRTLSLTRDQIKYKRN